MEKQGFIKNHADTLSIIGVNIGAIALLLNLILANTARIDASNATMDQLFQVWHQESKDFHGRLCAIEERNKK